MKYPFVSLVVVNYNGEKILEPCLKSLAKINYPKNLHEILVVDNHSSDRSLEIAEKFKIKIIRNKSNMGYVGINSCIGKIRGKYTFILNNDLELDKNCVRRLVKVLEEDDSIGVAAPKFVNFYQRSLSSGGTWVSRSFYTGHYKGTKKDSIKEIPYLGIEMVRTDTIKKFGYIYDPDYFIYAEDLDLSLRFRLIGYKTVFVPDAVVYHMHSVTSQKVLKARTTYLMERNLMITFFKIMSAKSIILFSPYVISMRLIGVAKDVLTLSFANAFSRVKALIFIATHPRFIYRKRKEMQKMRKVDDSYMLKIFSERYLFRPKFIA